ncbi:MAG: GNAT family N-acetyltransferase [Acidobacteria bacterium]|nr:GNAT family N-acetyltransferase [Acidobacteriota bacterium]
MVSYRFCRPDDASLLVLAVQQCWDVYGRDNYAFDRMRYRREVSEQHLWASSCMIACEGDDPIAVLMGAKRAHSTLITRLATHPEHVRRGHAAHLLDSLMRKLAILGPSRLRVEMPEDVGLLDHLLARMDFAQLVEKYVDLAWRGEPGPTTATGQVTPLTWEDVAQHHCVQPVHQRSWHREREAMAAVSDDLTVWALLSDRLEAVVAFRDLDQMRELWMLEWSPDARGQQAAKILLSDVCRSSHGYVVAHRWPQASRGYEFLISNGFDPISAYKPWAVTIANRI